MNKAIELHDSTVEILTKNDDCIVLAFRPAYIHQSNGIAGLDPGTGWTQYANLTLDQSRISGTWNKQSSTISDGILNVGTVEHLNSVPIPLNTNEHIELSLIFDTGEEMIFSSQGAKLELIGEPTYVEDFPGS